MLPSRFHQKPSSCTPEPSCWLLPIENMWMVFWPCCMCLTMFLWCMTSCCDCWFWGCFGVVALFLSVSDLSFWCRCPTMTILAQLNDCHSCNDARSIVQKIWHHVVIMAIAYITPFFRWLTGSARDLPKQQPAKKKVALYDFRPWMPWSKIYPSASGTAKLR